MKRIGILGGTFNPIHKGHIELGLKAHDQFGLDEVLFMPSGISYMKRDMDILDADIRCELVLRAIDGYPFFKLDKTEVLRKGPSYTFETLNELKAKTEDEYYFIVGADTLFMMDKWKSPEKVFELSKILVAVRDDYDLKALEEQIKYLKDKYKADIFTIDFNPLDISSTLIRSHIKKGESIDKYVPLKEAEYIKQKGLFC